MSPFFVLVYMTCAGILAVGGQDTCLYGQDPNAADSDKPLYQQQPFDLIYAKNNQQFRIVPLELPNRKVTPVPGGSLRVRLLRDPDKEFIIEWANIEKLVLFEDQVLEKAEQLTAKKDFGEAFRHYALLLDNYPGTERLSQSIQNYLFANASSLAEQHRYSEAMSALEELFQRNPEYVGTANRSVGSALSSVAGLVLRGYIDEQNYSSARKLLKRLDVAYGDARLPSLAELRSSMISVASGKADEVRQLVAQNKLMEAQIKSRELLRIWPDLPGAIDLARDVARQYPIASVGVLQRADKMDPASLYDWAARRTGRLLGRALVEFTGPGPEGGHYTSPFGKVIRGDDFQSLTFEVNVPSNGPYEQATAYDIADRLVAIADPNGSEYAAGWADIFDSVRPSGAQRLDVSLRRPHVVPEAFLRLSLTGSKEQPEWVNKLQTYELKERSDTQLRFMRLGSTDKKVKGPAEIRERYFDDESDAIEALRKGEILVVDRLFPGDAARLLGIDQDEIIVRRYGAPTLHMLVPNTDHPYMNSITFRGSLVYAIPRRFILDRMLEGHNLSGCRVITGPIPPGSSQNDPIGYAYDETLPEQPFDPGVSAILMGMAKVQLQKQAEQKMKPPPTLEKLVLAYPEDATAKFACQIIAAQLNQMKIVCELQQLPAGQVDDPERKYDLLYVSVTAQEPIVDVEWLLGSNGIARNNSPHVSLALRKIQEAKTWREARERLKQLHLLTYSEMTVIPLWQITEHYAHHVSVQGLNENIATLYQDVERWQIEPVVDTK